MAKIRLKFPAKCKECKADLEVGTLVRYYGRGRVYGTACHPQINPRTWIDRYYGNADDPATLSEMDMNRMLGVNT
jgi:hypothetical protein